MIVKILSSSAKFSGVVYNTSKVDRNKGDLMRVANFGPLQVLGRLRPQDYINYLQAIAAQNTWVKKPQFHAVLSAKGKSYSAKELTGIAEKWLAKMGYAEQPYLVIFHRDTDNNHVHVVSVRVDKNGKKINSAYENLRAIGTLKDVLGVNHALSYNFSTRSQFLMILENGDFPGKAIDEKLIAAKAGKYVRPEQRIIELRELFKAFKHQADFKEKLASEYHIELIFHSSDGKKPYGYSIIDHEQKHVMKGSEVMPLKELLSDNKIWDSAPKSDWVPNEDRETDEPVVAAIRPVWIADDVDDQQIHGMRRRRQKKARTNTR